MTRQLRCARNRLVEAEALGRVGEDVGVNRVRNVGLPVGDRAFLGGERLKDAAQPREHGETAVLELLDLELFEVTRLGEACLLYTSPSPRDQRGSRMPSSA